MPVTNKHDVLLLKFVCNRVQNNTRNVNVNTDLCSIFNQQEHPYNQSASIVQTEILFRSVYSQC